MKALFTIAVAITLRMPLTGIRSSRSEETAGVVRFLKTLAWLALEITSSLVISPRVPEPFTVARFTPSSLAIFLIGGLAMIESDAKAAALTIATGTAVAVAAGFTGRPLRDLASPASP